MKRSAQVALVLMGVTGTTAAGAYMMPPRPECKPAPAASTTLNPPQALNPPPRPRLQSRAAAAPGAAGAGTPPGPRTRHRTGRIHRHRRTGPRVRITGAARRRPFRPRSRRPGAAAPAAAHQKAQARPPRVAGSDRPAPQCPAAVRAAERHRHAECRVSATREFHVTAITGLFAISGSIVRPVRVCAGVEIGHVKRSENVGLVRDGCCGLRGDVRRRHGLLLRGKSQAMRRSRRPLRTSGAQRAPMARRIASRSGAALLTISSRVLFMAGRRAVRRPKL